MGRARRVPDRRRRRRRATRGGPRRARGARRRAPLARVRRPPVPRARRPPDRRRRRAGAGRDHRRDRTDRGRAPARASPTPTTWSPTTPACRSRRQRPDLAWFAYEDAGYKHIPGMMAWRVVEAVPLRPLAHADDRADACRTTRASAPRSSATCRSSRHCAPITRSTHGSTAQWPSSSGSSRLRPRAGSGCATPDAATCCSGPPGRCRCSTCCSRTCPSWSGRSARTSRS